MDAKERVIAYLLYETKADVCSKCVYHGVWSDSYKPCKAFDKKGRGACRSGLIQYFEQNHENRLTQE